MFQFWYRWLIVLTWLIIIFGLEMAFLNQTLLFDPINQQLNHAFWQSSEAPAEMIPYQQLMFGALGATTLGWGIMLLFLIRNSFAQRQRWAWWAIVISVDAWYLVDTLIAWQFGAYSFAIVNTLLVVAITPALIATRREFNQDSPESRLEWAEKPIT